MSKKFLASVGHAQLIGKRDGKLVHIADVQTLTESSLSFSSSMEDIRAGQGAKLYGRFNHTTGMSITLTDAMFDLDYIGYQVGAVAEGDATGLFSEELKINDGSIVLTKKPQDIGVACGLDVKAVWVRKFGCSADSDWELIELTDDRYAADTKTVDLTNTNFENEDSVCVRYFIRKPESRKINVSANFIPAEMMLILTTRLYAGDANNVETGKPVGSVTVKVPRFQLDGQFDLSMAMTSAASMSLNGTALAVSDGTCQDNGIYAEIVEILDDADYTYDLVEVIKGEDGEFTGVYRDGHMSELDEAEDNITAYSFADGQYTRVMISDLEDGNYYYFNSSSDEKDASKSVKALYTVEEQS